MEELDSIADFLTSRPPLSQAKIFNFTDFPISSLIHSRQIRMPAVKMYCDSETCKGLRVFRCNDAPYIGKGTVKFFATYTCSNCLEYTKIYAMAYRIENEDSLNATVTKFGEMPPYGSPIPTKAIALIGPDRELFLKGRRSENQGLGIAAFAYYRRIIENQWVRLLEEVKRVATKTGSDPDVQQHIEAALKERQFDKAVKSIGDAIPNALRMNGQNPISLLYAALSQGIHAQSDEECLELAVHIRVILYELAERLNAALQEHNELDAAVKRLASRKNPSTKTDS